MKFYKLKGEDYIFFSGNVLYTELGTIINPTTELMLDDGWSIYEEEISPEEQLLTVKELKILEISDYDSSSNVEEFTINNIPMWLNHDLRQLLRTSADAYTALGYDTMTKVFNGAEFTFPISNWILMLNALEVYAAEALNTTERHKNNVNNLLTLEEVELYDYTTGYPLKLSF